MKKKITIYGIPNRHIQKQKCKQANICTFQKLHQKNLSLTINLVNKLIFNPVCSQKISRIIQKQPSKQLITYSELQKNYSGEEFMKKLYSFSQIKQVISQVINFRSIKNVYRFVDFKIQHYTITNKYAIDLCKLIKFNSQKYNNQIKDDSKLSTKSGQNKILKDLYAEDNKKIARNVNSKRKKKITSQKVQLQILTQNLQQMIRNIQDNRQLQNFKKQMENKRIFNTYKLKNMFQKTRQQQFKRNIDKDIFMLQNKKLDKNYISQKKLQQVHVQSQSQRLQTNPGPEFQQYGLSIIKQSKYNVNTHMNAHKKRKSKQKLQHNYFIRLNSKNKHSRQHTEKSELSKDKHSRIPTQYDSTVIGKIDKGNKSKQKIRNVYSPCFNKIKSKSKSKSHFSSNSSKSKQKFSLKFHMQKK